MGRKDIKINYMLKECDVCILIDNDYLLKENVLYCSLCKKWMCDRCRNDLIRRAKALVKDVSITLKEVMRGF